MLALVTPHPRAPFLNRHLFVPQPESWDWAGPTPPQQPMRRDLDGQEPSGKTCPPVKEQADLEEEYLDFGLIRHIL